MGVKITISHKHVTIIFRNIQRSPFNIEKYRTIILILPVNFENVLIATAILLIDVSLKIVNKRNWIIRGSPLEDYHSGRARSSSKENTRTNCTHLAHVHIV